VWFMISQGVRHTTKCEQTRAKALTTGVALRPTLLVSPPQRGRASPAVAATHADRYRCCAGGGNRGCWRFGACSGLRCVWRASRVILEGTGTRHGRVGGLGCGVEVGYAAWWSWRPAVQSIGRAEPRCIELLSRGSRAERRTDRTPPSCACRCCDQRVVSRFDALGRLLTTT
jgi:hypothetical protein